MKDMETNEKLERIRDISVKVVRLLREERASDSMVDMVLTRILAATYSFYSKDVAESLVRLHADNLRWSIREIKEDKANLN